jgi:ATP-dependent helicase YprA (DUF1998 family)
MPLGLRAIRLLAGPAGSSLRHSYLHTYSPTLRTSTALFHPIRQRCQWLSTTASQIKVLEEEKGDNEPSSEPLLQEQLTREASRIQSRLPSWLRPYQVQVIVECIKALNAGLQRIGVSSPTGSGKTVML